MAARSDQIIDVEFETVTPAAVMPAGAAPPPVGLGLFGAGRRRHAAEPMPLPLFAAIAVISSLVSFYASGGYVLLADRSATDAPAPIADTLAIEHSETRVDTSGGRPVLVIRATIANRGDVSATVPAVTIGFDKADGTGSVTHTIVRGERLAPGERMAFTSRVPAGEYAATEPRIALAPTR